MPQVLQPEVRGTKLDFGPSKKIGFFTTLTEVTERDVYQWVCPTCGEDGHHPDPKAIAPQTSRRLPDVRESSLGCWIAGFVVFVLFFGIPVGVAIWSVTLNRK